jgi:hypothetical protein
VSELFGTGITLGTDDAFSKTGEKVSDKAARMLETVGGVAAYKLYNVSDGKSLTVSQITKEKALSQSWNDHILFHDANGTNWRLLYVEADGTGLITLDTPFPVPRDIVPTAQAVAWSTSPWRTYLNGTWLKDDASVDPAIRSIIKTTSLKTSEGTSSLSIVPTTEQAFLLSNADYERTDIGKGNDYTIGTAIIMPNAESGQVYVGGESGVLTRSNVLMDTIYVSGYYNSYCDTKYGILYFAKASDFFFLRPCMRIDLTSPLFTQ